LRRFALTFAATAAATLIVVTAALASAGDPPRGMSPIAGSIYRAQFGLCSLETLSGLASKQGVVIETLSVRAAAGRLALAREKGTSAAAVQGCRQGLLYRHAHDHLVAGLRGDLKGRIAAEKYVAAVYILFTLLFFLWVVIHAAKVARLDREVRILIDRIDRAPHEVAVPSRTQ
jgi:hypothetical protein